MRIIAIICRVNECCSTRGKLWKWILKLDSFSVGFLLLFGLGALNKIRADKLKNQLNIGEWPIGWLKTSRDGISRARRDIKPAPVYCFVEIPRRYQTFRLVVFSGDISEVAVRRDLLQWLGWFRPNLNLIPNRPQINFAHRSTSGEVTTKSIVTRLIFYPSAITTDETTSPIIIATAAAGRQLDHRQVNIHHQVTSQTRCLQPASAGSYLTL